MENGEWRMENGEWRMENGEWSLKLLNIMDGIGNKVQTTTTIICIDPYMW
jgi:hypothetical protein